MPQRKQPGSVGRAKKNFFTFCDPPHEMDLEGGGRLGPVTLAYETYGRLNRDKTNALLILHALSGDSHAAGKYSADDRKPGCQGSTGPSSIHPATGKPYALSFPIITLNDMVHAQRRLIDHLGIERLFAVTGGSMGGMQALQWAVSYPDRVLASIPIATTAKHSPPQIAFNQVGRGATQAVPNFHNGDYYDREIP